ncbi:MAG: DUF4394 domain-containing protein [Gammaproteobacteria bacterium]
MYARTLSDRAFRHIVIRHAGWCLGLAMAVALSASPARATNSDSVGLKVFGLTGDQWLVKFRSDRPRRLQKIGPIAGLNSADTALVGIDFRVQDGKLYGLGNGGGIYTIDTRTGVASEAPESPLTVPLVGNFFGVDFNPAANALRIISDTGQNLRHRFAPQFAPQRTAQDTDLVYPAIPATPTTPAIPATPGIGVTGAAYTNNDLDPNTATTLFDIDSQRNQVVIQSPPNAGVLTATGGLTVDPDASVGFDIYSRLKNGATFSNTSFASLMVGGKSRFYSVRLLTGRAFLIGAFPVPMADIAVALKQ